ncbi:hypothetical protein LV779_19110 [Streptomyces thinghirensis]|nr:hypothetical protein [Streptomyces thinghirensis]
MVVLADKLEKDGLAERIASPTDRRARMIRATQAGLDLLARSNEIVSRIQDDVLGTLPEELRGALRRGADPTRRRTAVHVRGVRAAAPQALLTHLRHASEAGTPVGPGGGLASRGRPARRRASP